MPVLTQQPEHTGRGRDWIRLVDLLATVFGRWRAVVAGAMVGLLIGAGIMLLQPPRYVSRVNIWVRAVPRTLDVAFIDNQRNISIDTEAQRITSTEVLTQAGIPDARSVEITAPPNANVLRVRITAQSPELAQARAQAIAEAYLDARRAFLRERREELSPAIERQTELLTDGLRENSSPAVKRKWKMSLETLLATRALYESARADPGSVVRAATPGRLKRRNWQVLPVSLAALGGIGGYAVSYAAQAYRTEE